MFDITLTITFNVIILIALIVRASIIFIEAIWFLTIIGGKDNIDFMKQHFKINLIDYKSLISWGITILSIMYFEWAIYSYDDIPISKAFTYSMSMSLFIIFSFILLILYSIFNARQSILEAHTVNMEILKAINIKKSLSKSKEIIEKTKTTSFMGSIGKYIANSTISITNDVIDNKIQTTLKEKIDKLIVDMMISSFITLFIIMLSLCFIKDLALPLSVI